MRPKITTERPRVTPSLRLADLSVGGLDEFVRSRRAAGKGWRTIAAELTEATDGRVPLSHETLRRGYRADTPDPDRVNTAA